MKKIKYSIWLSLGFVISLILFGYLFLVHFVPTGNDIYGHLYKMNTLYDHIKEGDWYPLFVKDWYNGIQLFRYWPILTYYVMAFFKIFGEDTYVTYYLFLSFTFFLSFFGWFLIGVREKKDIYFLFGLLYWFLPDNIRVTFGEGNLARLFLFSLLPLFFYFFTNVLEYKKQFLFAVLMVILLTMTHFMLAAMCAVIFCIYGFFVGLRKKTWYHGFLVFISGFLLSGILLIPGVTGGVVSDNNAASINTMKDWSQSLLLSLSFQRTGTICSFGLCLFVICLYAIFFKKQKIGLCIGLLFFLLTDTIFIDFFIQLPLSQVWWMARFVQMCYVLILYDLGKAEWKKGIPVLLFFLVLFLDISPSYSYLIPKEEPDMSPYLLEEAVKETDSRLALIDESMLGSYPSFYITERGCDYVQGWAIQGAGNKNVIINCTEAMEQGYYEYAFQRLLEMGCDTVVVYKGILYDLNETAFRDAYVEYGYELRKENDSVYLLHLKDTPSSDTFGTNYTYDNLAIGSSSSYICYLYPGFQKGTSNDISDYDMEELVKYKKIFLSGFQCKDKATLEKFLNGLNKRGVKVYVDMNSILNNDLFTEELLGVQCRYTTLMDEATVFRRKIPYHVMIPYEWFATYLYSEKDDFVMYSFDTMSESLNYMAVKENINLLGLNIPYLYLETKQLTVKELLDDIFEIEASDYHIQKEVVPLSVSYEKDKISVQSPKDVTTSIAWQDIFQNDTIENHAGFLKVKEGNTVMTFCYPEWKKGILVSVIGILLLLICLKKNVRQ